MQTLSLSSRAQGFNPSPTLGITAKANAMKAEGIDVVSLAAGEPDFNTPETVCQAAIEALQKGFTKYTPSSGTKELKEAIVAKLARENSLQYKPEQIVVSCGAKHSLYNTFMTLLDPGDEVIIFAPYWMTYPEQIRIAGGVPVVVKTEADSGFIPTAEAIKAAITSKTKAIVVNSPSNPTGALIPREVLKEIAALALKHGLWVISDEIYERLIYGATHTSMAALGSEIATQTITIGGCSKSYAMTGWRIGFAAAPVQIAKAMSNLQDQVTSNPTSFAQVGATAAFKLDASVVEAMRAQFEMRRNLIIEQLGKLPNVKTAVPQGAFYVLPDFSAYLGGKCATDVELAAYLLEEANVAVIPGSVFEGYGHLRMSYATSPAMIEKGIQRIGEALAKL